MRVERAVFRARDVKDNIVLLRTLLSGREMSEVAADRMVEAAMERFLEIVSEASRNLPEEWKRTFGGTVNWRAVADLGNNLRHAYRDVELKILWSIYTHDLDPLERAIDAMIAAHPIDL